MKAHLNKGLFSNYYLQELLPREEGFKIPLSELGRSLEEIKRLLDKKYLSSLNEPQLRKHFLDKVFEILGWTIDVEPPTPSGEWSRHPDYALFHNPEDLKLSQGATKEEYFKKTLCLGEAKHWGRALDKKVKVDTEDPQNPSLQISRYLWLTEVKWGILTDGRYWRLYERETSKRLDIFYEIDLEDLIENGSIEDFKYFCLFFRRDAFPDFLEKVYKESVDYAEAVGKELKENVYQALKTLAQGFLKTPENDLKEIHLKEIHDNSLILLYRLLFILYAEYRDLLPLGENQYYTESYSLDVFKKEIADRLDKHEPIATSTHGYWNKLKELFEIINIGNRELGVPPYNGGLFEPDKHEFLERYRMGDLYIANAVDLLSRSSDRAYIDYGSLEIRHLGSIYEGLLEYKLKIAEEKLVSVKEKGKEVFIPLEEAKKAKKKIKQEEIVREGEIYLATDKGERKATGSYYTPNYIVNYIIDNTLEPLVQMIYRESKLAQEIKNNIRYFNEIFEEIVKERGGGEKQNLLKLWNLTRNDQERRDFLLNLLDGAQPSHGYDPLERILQLKILDPAMGSGHFLVEATDFLARELLKVLSGEPLLKPSKEMMIREGEEPYDSTEPEEEDIRWARREVVERCIFGVDLNPLAVELAKLSLWLYTVAKNRPLNFLDHHLRCGNSLIGARIEYLVSPPSLKKKKPENAFKQLGLFENAFREKVAILLKSFELIEAHPSDTVEQIREKESYYQDFRRALSRFQDVADVWTSVYFGNEIDFGTYQKLQNELRATDEEWERLYQESWFEKAKQIFEEKRFFHYELEFPEVFFQGHQRKENPGFDAVVGNPPYVKVDDITQDERGFLMKSDLYNTTIKRMDLFISFHELSIGLLKNNGRHSFIVPYPLLTQDYGQKLRFCFLTNTRIISITDLSKWKIFPDATVRNIIPVIKKEKRGTKYMIEVITQEKDPNIISAIDGSIRYIDADHFMNTYENMFRIDLSSDIYLIKKKIDKISANFGRIFAASWGARGVPVNKFHLNKPINKYCKRMVKGENIESYGLTYSNKWLLYKNLYRPSMPEFFENEKIIFQKVTGQYGLIGVFDNQDFYTDDSLICCIPKFCFERHSKEILGKHKIYIEEGDIEISKKYNILYVLAIMNSMTNGFYFSKFIGYDLNVYPESIEYIPIRLISFVTTKAGREKLLEEAKYHYKSYLESGDFDTFLYFVESRFVKKYQPDGELVKEHNTDSLKKDWQIPAGALWEQSDVVHDVLAFLAKQMIEINNQKQMEIKGFLKWLENQLKIQLDEKGNIGIEGLTGKSKLKNYLGDYQKGKEHLSFEELWKILEKNKNRVQANLKSRGLFDGIKTEYEKSLSRLLSLKEKLRKTDWLIDQIVYKLYGLTEEEIRIIEEHK